MLEGGGSKLKKIFFCGFPNHAFKIKFHCFVFLILLPAGLQGFAVPSGKNTTGWFSLKHNHNHGVFWVVGIRGTFPHPNFPPEKNFKEKETKGKSHSKSHLSLHLSNCPPPFFYKHCIYPGFTLTTLINEYAPKKGAIVGIRSSWNVEYLCWALDPNRDEYIPDISSSILPSLKKTWLKLKDDILW